MGAARRHARDAADGAPPELSQTALTRRLHAIAVAAEKLVSEMEFEFLFEPTRKLFSIGYRVADGSLDSGYYETFNLPHVRLVDLRQEPIETITEKGIDTKARSFLSNDQLDIFLCRFPELAACAERATSCLPKR